MKYLEPKDMQGLAPYIRYLVYATLFMYPLLPIIGDGILWIAAMMAVIDVIVTHQSIRLSLWCPKDRMGQLVWAFAMWCAVSSALGHYPIWSLIGWAYQVFTWAVMYTLIRRYIIEPRHWRYAFYTVLTSAMLVCILGIIQYAFLPNIHMHEWVDAEHFPKLMRRMSSTLLNPNLLGAYLLMVLSVVGAVILAYAKMQYWKRAGMYMGFAIVFFLVMLLTYSRGIWLSFAAMIFYWGIFVERRLLWSLVVIPITLFWYKGEISSRLWSLFQDNDTSVALRWALWDSTTYIIEDNPITGIGWNAFIRVYPDYNYFIQSSHIMMFHAHNMFLNMAAEVGMVGLLLFLILVGYHWYCISRYTHSFYGTICYYAMGALVVGLCVSGLSDFELYSHQVGTVFFQFLGITAAVALGQDKYTKNVLSE